MTYLPFLAMLAAASMAVAAEPPFLAIAAQSDLAVVEMGQLAEARGLSARTRTLGRMLADDLGRHHATVTALAEARRIKLPPGPSATQKAECAFMAHMKGAAFDEAFKARVIADRQRQIAEYRALLSNADPDVAALAEQTLPILERHLAAAKAL